MDRRFLLAVLLCAGAVAPVAPAADTWKVAPPPPASWQRDRLSDLAARRQAVAAQIGEKGILILYAAEPRNYAGDVDWPYRQENDFFYLTGIPQEGGALVMLPGAPGTREILFLPPSNPSQESWTGHILTPTEGRRISGIETIWDARRLGSFLSTLLPRARTVFAEPAGRPRRAGAGGEAPAPAPAPPIPVDVAGEFAGQIGSFGGKKSPVFMLLTGRAAAAEFRREAAIAKQLGALDPPIKVRDASPIFSRLRAVKSPREIDLVQHAVDITAEAFERAFAVSVPGAPEYEVQAQFEFTFLRRNAHWGYPCIVASGVNSTTLHYETNRDSMKAGDLLLMDAAAEFDGYSADITRTIPVSGRFSPPQAGIYRLVWAAQKAGIDAARPGRTPAEVLAAADKVLGEGLFRLGLVTSPTSTREIRIWMNHGISHGIGLNVHDPAAGPASGWREYRPGMVITMEPGLYFRLDALDNLPKTEENRKFIAAVRGAYDKYKGIGVRIEDDILIADGPATVMSAAIPSKLEDVEASIARLRDAMQSSPPR
jgi:Xaa-Pro aminopeptidase